ncbi:hypothetical protein CCH79_00008776 [Gambusia affinis]|uniref:Cellular retinoic acid-binding protein 1 n=1 Tax=Gambusia affinis TaxID=33528 RepID=A0A315V8A7_GAMAF|nr:hypothetical protein CCH79_00008776 [Gambusia affinis]
MVDQFVGTWKMISSENFDDYMKALGVGFATRQVGNRTKPNFVMSVDDQGMICMKSQSAFKTTEVKFKLNEPFEETTADDRKTRTVVSLDSGKLIQKQSWDGQLLPDTAFIWTRLVLGTVIAWPLLAGITLIGVRITGPIQAGRHNCVELADITLNPKCQASPVYITERAVVKEIYKSYHDRCFPSLLTEVGTAG